MARDPTHCLCLTGAVPLLLALEESTSLVLYICPSFLTDTVVTRINPQLRPRRSDRLNDSRSKSILIMDIPYPDPPESSVPGPDSTAGLTDKTNGHIPSAKTAHPSGRESYGRSMQFLRGLMLAIFFFGCCAVYVASGPQPSICVQKLTDLWQHSLDPDHRIPSVLCQPRMVLRLHGYDETILCYYNDGRYADLGANYNTDKRR